MLFPICGAWAGQADMLSTCLREGHRHPLEISFSTAAPDRMKPDCPVSAHTDFAEHEADFAQMRRRGWAARRTALAFFVQSLRFDARVGCGIRIMVPRCFEWNEVRGDGFNSRWMLCSLSQRERAGVRENALKVQALTQVPTVSIH
jgi:hypothetical protein